MGADARQELIESILAFRHEREWEQFHTPKNLAISIALEASELLSIFQWTGESELDSRVDDKRGEIEDEIADVYIYLLFLCYDLGVNLDEAGLRKLRANAEKYPVNRSRANARKYNEF